MTKIVNYGFSNLLGTSYKKGNLIFNDDGRLLFSIIGNRLNIYDLKTNKSKTMPIESKYNYVAIDISPNKNILIAADENGEIHVISLSSYLIINKYRLLGNVQAIKFSPNGKYFVVCKETNDNNASVIHSYYLRYVFTNASDETTCIDWTCDSQFFAVGSKDMSTFIYCSQRNLKYKAFQLSGGHTDAIVACFFEKNSLDITTVSKNGQMCIWESNQDIDTYLQHLETLMANVSKKKRKYAAIEDIVLNNESECPDDRFSASGVRDDEIEIEIEDKSSTNLVRFRFKKIARHYLADEPRKSDRNAYVTAAAYHKSLKILVSGFSNGAFFIHELPDVNLIHSLSIFDHDISTISINPSGDWIALGSMKFGQLLVWSWQNESYVLKQQGHINNICCVSYSLHGDYLATGSIDGKVKIWDTSTGFCVVTFTDHIEAVTGIVFCTSKKVIISSSLDGTVRAFDTIRYRNFRVFTTPKPTQFSCVAVDTKAEFVAAAAQDLFHIFLWCMKSDQLLEILNGHIGPVASIAFSPILSSTQLISVSWDKTVKIWDAIEKGSEHETIDVLSDGLCCAFKPSGDEFAVATLSGQISMFNLNGQQLSCIEGRKDLDSGVSETDLISAKQNLKAKAFTSMCYSADGECILAGGHSKNICIYNVKQGILLKKFVITQNQSLDDVNDFINRRNLTEFGNLKLVEERDVSEGGNVTIKLPGVRRADLSLRNVKPEVRIFSLQFSPTGQSFAAATTEGVLLYRNNVGYFFDPWLPDVNINPQSIRDTFLNQDYSLALIMSLKLNDLKIIQETVEKIPISEVKVTVDNLQEQYLEKLFDFLSQIVETSNHLDAYLIWIKLSLIRLGKLPDLKLKEVSILSLQKAIFAKQEKLVPLCNFNKYSAGNLLKMNRQSKNTVSEGIQ